DQHSAFFASEGFVSLQHLTFSNVQGELLFKSAQ
ncbi:hypothetical protein LCGC14_2082980, partial [marine sediment metagenome]